MKISIYILLSLISLSLSAQNESVFSGVNFSSYFIEANGSLSGTDSLVSDGAGNGTFTGGAFTYTIDKNYNFLFVEDFGTETHTYIGATDPTGEYSILIPDPAEGGTGLVSSIKLSDSKTNASFHGEFITSYYRYNSPEDYFIGLFLVTADGVNKCSYHQLMGTAAADDEDFSYTVDNEGRIALSNSSSEHVISAVINNSEDCYAYASIMNGFSTAGHGVEKLGELDFSEIQGKYKLMQLRYVDSYKEQSSSLLTMTLNEDGTGSYVIDSNTHGESTVGTLAASYQADGIWKIVLDNNSDYTIYGAINPTEKLIVGYFNYEGNCPGVIFGINKEVITPSYTISGILSGANNVDIEVTGDITDSILVENSDDNYSFKIEQGQSITLTPVKKDYYFTPASITINDVQENQSLETFYATAITNLKNINSNKLKIFPNPASHLLNIEADNIITVELVDLTGKVLETYNCSFKSNIQINLNSKYSGLYLIRIINNDGISQRRLLIN